MSAVDIDGLKWNAISGVIEREGDYVNHPADRGGPTRWGVTQAKAREHGYLGCMKCYPRDEAFAVYELDYWHQLMLDDVSDFSTDLAIQLFDFGVNSGVSRAAKFLQRLLNSLNHKAEHYSDIKSDGWIGSATMSALKGFHEKRGDYGLIILTKSLSALRIAFCVGITEGNESQESFAFGWLSRIVHL